MSSQEDFMNLRHRNKGIFGMYMLKGRIGGGYMGNNLDEAVQKINGTVQESDSRAVVIKSVSRGEGFFGGLNLIEDNALKGLVEKLNTNKLGIKYTLDSK